MSGRENFLAVFSRTGGLLPKISRNFFLNQRLQFIHQSKALVEFSRNMLLLTFFEVIFGPNNPKNNVQNSFKKNHYLGLKPAKNGRF
jgi:hypothetical protein